MNALLETLRQGYFWDLRIPLTMTVEFHPLIDIHWKNDTSLYPVVSLPARRPAAMWQWCRSLQLSQFWIMRNKYSQNTRNCRGNLHKQKQDTARQNRFSISAARSLQYCGKMFHRTWMFNRLIFIWILIVSSGADGGGVVMWWRQQVPYLDPVAPREG